MPVITEPLHDQQLSVKRRVVMQMAKHILDVIGADTRVTIRYKGNMENLMTWGSDRYDAIDPLYFGQEDILELEVREQVSADMITPLRVHGKEYTPLWYRGEYPAYLSVNYLPVHWTISAKYLSRSDERMQNFQSRLSYRIALSNVVSLEAVHYLLTLPKPFLTLMTLFHAMEEKAYPTGRSLMDWMSAYALDKGLVSMTNQAGNGGHPVFREIQQDLLMMLSLTEIPEKEKRDKHPGSSVDFELEMHWSRPNGMSMHYPVTIFNQLIPNAYIPRVESRRADAGQLAHSDVLQKNLVSNMNEFYYSQNLTFTEHHGIVIPVGDDWQYGARQFYLRPVFTSLIRIKKDNQPVTSVATVKQLNRYIRLSPSIIRFLKEDPERLTTARFSPLTAIVVHGDVRVDPTLVKVDENLSITTTAQLTRKDVLHVQYCVPVNYRHFPKEFFQLMMFYPDLVDDIFELSTVNVVMLGNYITTVRCEKKGTVAAKQMIWRRLYNGLEWQTFGYWLTVEMALMCQIESFNLSHMVLPLFDEWLAKRNETVGEFYRIYTHVERYLALQQFRYVLWEHIKENKLMSSMSYWGVLKEDFVRNTFLNGLNSTAQDDRMVSGTSIRTILSFALQSGAR